MIFTMNECLILSLSQLHELFFKIDHGKMRRFIIKAHDKVTCARIQCKAGRASQILTCACTTRESCENEGSNSIGTGWGLRFCILKQHSCGVDAGSPQTTLWVANAET